MKSLNRQTLDIRNRDSLSEFVLLLLLSTMLVSAVQFGSPSLVFALSFSLAVLTTGAHLTRRR